MLPLKPALLLESLKMGAFAASGLLEMIAYSVLRPRFWWMRRQGRAAEVDAIVFRMAEAWAARILRRLDAVLDVQGREHIPPAGPLLVMCNHQSLFDIPVLMASMGRITGFVAKRELFRLPGFSYWMRQIHSFSLDRSNAAAAARVFAEASRMIKETQVAIILFPEGTRTRDPGGRIGPFREGSVRLATGQDIPILPVSIDGTRFFRRPELMRRTRRGGRLVRLRFAPVVNPHVRSAPERRALVEGLRNTIVTNHEAIRVEWPAQPAEPRPLPHTEPVKP